MPRPTACRRARTAGRRAAARPGKHQHAREQRAQAHLQDRRDAGVGDLDGDLVDRPSRHSRRSDTSTARASSRSAADRGARRRSFRLMLMQWRRAAGRAAASRSSVVMVDWSMRPSTRSGRKWRWKAVTTNSVLGSKTAGRPRCRSRSLPAGSARQPPAGRPRRGRCRGRPGSRARAPPSGRCRPRARRAQGNFSPGSFLRVGATSEWASTRSRPDAVPGDDVPAQRLQRARAAARGSPGSPARGRDCGSRCRRRPS